VDRLAGQPLPMENSKNAPSTTLKTGRLAPKELVWFVIGVLVLGVPLWWLFRNNSRVKIEQYHPQDSAASDTVIEIMFDTAMSEVSVREHFSIVPSVVGELTWPSARHLQFVPAAPLPTDTQYTVTLKAGAASQDHKKTLKDDLHFSFRVRWPQVIFLGPASAAAPNLYLLDVASKRVRQLTNVTSGILDYAASLDGQWIAYATRREGNLSDIWVLNLATQETIQLTNCADVEADCENPAWHPDGGRITYSRRELSVSSGRAHTSRVWVVDLATRTSKLLFDDIEFEGCCPKWAPSGVRIAIFTSNPLGVLVYDFPSNKSVFVATEQGLVGGTFAADGSRLIYPVLRLGPAGSSYYQHFQMISFDTFGEDEATDELLSGPIEAPVEDIQAAFHPDGRRVALVRRYLDSRYAIETQVYILNLTTRTVEPVTDDPHYSNGAISWSVDGNLLLMQRYTESPNQSGLSIWVYVVSTGELRMIYSDGFLPQFLP
jgi:Tol biopolymer transport system component